MLPQPLHLLLREATRADHDAVDAAFGAFGVTERDRYAQFLTAHARILPAVERATDPGALMAGWEGRTEALVADLAALGLAMPPPAPIQLPPGDAARWGAIYVVEGSRLGGLMMSRQVPVGLPSAYLSARHGPGGWRALLDAIDAAEPRAAGKSEPDEPWRVGAVAGARATFTAYLEAANWVLGVEQA